MFYYVYAYLRYDGSPYYIGKGKGNRINSKSRTVPVPKNKSLIVIMESNLTNVGALALERFYIRWYGRKDLGTGILRNRTDGGDGGDNLSKQTKDKMSSSHVGKKFTETTCRKMSESKKGLKKTEEHKANLSKSLKGKQKSLETKIKMSESQKRRIFSEETRKKMSAAAKIREETKRLSNLSGKGEKNDRFT